MSNRNMKIIAATFMVVMAFTTLSSHAAVTTVGSGAFSGSPQIDFGPTPTGAPIDGQTINGVGFHFTISGTSSNDAVLDDGPGTTNNVSVANVEGNIAGDLSLVFPQPELLFGFGYAELAMAPSVSNAITIQLYDAANNPIGAESYTAAPDPTFDGGFAGIHSDTPFVRADVTFAGVRKPARRDSRSTMCGTSACRSRPPWRCSASPRSDWLAGRGDALCRRGTCARQSQGPLHKAVLSYYLP